MKEGKFCAQISQERQDPFVGLAAHADLWLMVEYTGPWEYMSIYNNRLPEHVTEWLTTIANNYLTLHTIVLFVRKDSRPLDRVRCFVGVTREEREALYAFEFASYDEVPTLDLEALRAGVPEYDRYRTSEPMYLVCTNGKHDMCCARFGMPIHREANRIDGAHTWHCSHIGGDQYAANMLCLPHGIYYSRVTVPEVERIIEADRQRRLYMPKSRGRTCYPPIVQAAEQQLRERTGITDLDAFHLLDSTAEAEGRETIRFQSATDKSVHCLTMEGKQYEAPQPPCRCDPLGKNLRFEFHLIDYKVLQPAHQ